MKTTLYKLLGLKFLSLCIMALLLSFTTNAQQPAASLEQGRNGNYAAPLDPIAWVNGNLNSQQAHMVEGYSVPYRVIMTNLVVGTPIEIEIQYDTRHSSRHALDFITYYDNMEPHWIWGHAAPTIDPLSGYPAVPSTPAYATIPPPTQGLLVNGVMEPQTTFNNLPANLKRMTLFGGIFAAINPVSYTLEDPIGAGAPAQTSTTVMIKFTPTSSTAILAWGGHIATSITFGDGNSAGGINGSPYHSRLIDWNLNNLGNQDRSLSAASVVQLPECDFSFTPSSPVCINTQMSFTIDNPMVNSTYAWSVTNNGTNASPLSGNGTSFIVSSGTLAGSFTVEATATVMFAGNPLTATCSTVVDVNSISLNNTKVDVACYGDNSGSIDLTVIGGTAPFTYAWVASNGGVVPVGQSGSQDLTSLVAGTYSVTVTDFSGCSAMTSVNILQPATALTTSATKVDVLCYGLATGSIDLSVSGGTAPYSYAWSASLGGVVPVGQSGLQDLTGLVAGTYSVVVTDANGCVANRSVVILQPAAALTTSATKVDVLCYGLATGSIDLSVSGGTAPYSYAWSASLGGVVPVGQSGLQDLTGLVAGTYSVVVTDANGCVANRSVVILQPAAALATSATKVDVLCYGDATGSIDLSVSGGTAPYSYAWSASLGGVVPVGQSGLQDLTGLVAGTYSVVVTDANGCVANRSVVILQPAAALVCIVDEPVAAVICNTTGNILSAVVNGGTGAYSYVWSVSNPAWVITGGQGTASVEYTAGGGVDALTFFILTVTDANGCVSVCSLEVACTTPDPEPEFEYCTKSQGFYGNLGGVHCDNRGTLQLVDDLLIANGGMVLGVPANNKTFTIGSGDASCLISILPGGGPAAVLPGVNGCGNFGNLLSKQGKIRNILLAQTIALQLNVWLDLNLAGAEFTGPDFFTMASTSCGDGLGDPIPGTEQYYTFPASVYSYIDMNYPAVTVGAVLDVANKALGGEAGLPSLGDITATIEMIINAFHDCRWLDFGVAPVVARKPAPVETTRDMQINVNMAPNPFSVSTHITFTLSKDSKAVVEVYDMIGSKIATLFEGDVKAGQEETILFTAPSTLRAKSMMVVVRTAEGYESKRLILSR